MARGFSRYASVVNLGSRAFTGIKGFFGGRRAEAIQDATNTAHRRWLRDNPDATPAQITANQLESAAAAAGSNPGFFRGIGLKIGLIGGGTYLAANVAENISENGVVDGLGETADDVNSAFSAVAHPFETLERTAQRRAANLEAVQATIAGLEAQVSGQTPLLGILGFLQSLFPESTMIQSWIDDRQDKISSLREQMVAAGTGGYGEDPTSGDSSLPVLETATVGALAYGAYRGVGAMRNNMGGGGNDGRGNNAPDRAGIGPTGGADGDAPATRAARTSTPRLGGRLGRRLGSLLNLRNAFVGAAGTAALAGTANAAQASAEYTAADVAQDAVSVAIPVAADVIDVVGHVQDGDYSEAAVTAASATVGGLSSAFAAATTGAAVGTFIPIPIVGTALGFVAGGAVGIGTYMLTSGATEAGLNWIFNREASDAQGPTAEAPVTRISFINSGPSAAMPA